MKPFTVGDFEVSSIIEREGPIRPAAVLFPKSDPEIAAHHLHEISSRTWSPTSGILFNTYQTFVLRRRGEVILIDFTLVLPGTGNSEHLARERNVDRGRLYAGDKGLDDDRFRRLVHVNCQFATGIFRSFPILIARIDVRVPLLACAFEKAPTARDEERIAREYATRLVGGSVSHIIAN